MFEHPFLFVTKPTHLLVPDGEGIWPNTIKYGDEPALEGIRKHHKWNANCQSDIYWFCFENLTFYPAKIALNLTSCFRVNLTNSCGDAGRKTGLQNSLYILTPSRAFAWRASWVATSRRNCLRWSLAACSYLLLQMTRLGFQQKEFSLDSRSLRKPIHFKIFWYLLWDS